MKKSHETSHGFVWAFHAMACVVMLGILGCNPPEPATPPAKPAEATKPAEAPKPAEAVKMPAAPDAEGWRSVFDGKTLTGWKVTPFGGEGKVEVNDGQLILNMGAADLTGVTWAGGDLPKTDYEVSLEAMRVDGSDFFCGLTFPVRDSFASLIVGGWGGSLVGISCFDYADAANNETTKMISFENKRWYKIRLRVTEKKIEAWIDDSQVVDAEPGTRKISVRMEVEESKPFGLAAWRTKAALKNIRIRTL
jgi:hypothetical protein